MKTWQKLLPEAEKIVSDWHTDRVPTNVEMWNYNQQGRRFQAMKIGDVYPDKSNWLRAADLNGKEVKVVVESVTVEEMPDGEKKLCLWFVGKEKGCNLNVTNARTMAEAFGDETDGWTAKEVILFSEKTQFQGKPCLGLRVRIPQDVVADEEIPF